MNVTRENLLKIAGISWCSPKDFEKALTESCVSRRTMIVPSLVGSDELKCLRIKIIDKGERNRVCNWVKNNSFEKVKSCCGKIEVFFGMEPNDLEHNLSLGILVSHWGREPNVKALTLKYSFGVACLGGSRRI